MGVYNILEKADKDTIFLYATILILSIGLFKRYNIKLNIILGLFIAILLIVYKSEEIEEKGNQANLIQQKKRALIKPEPKNIVSNDLVDYLFSIQEFYNYNPQAYEELVDAIDSFILIKDIINEGDRFCEKSYNIAVTKKHDALNALHSIIHKTPQDRNFNKKFNKSILVLEEILNGYLEEMYKKCNEKIIREGYNIERKIIDRGPKGLGHYKNSEIFTYDFF